MVGTRKEAFASSQKILKKWHPLLAKFARTVADQKDCLVALEVWVMEEAWVKHKLMMPIAKTLYDEVSGTSSGCADVPRGVWVRGVIALPTA